MEFFQPESKEELINLLKIKKEDTYFAAGCTDLMIKLREKNIYPYNLIDLTHIKEGREILETRDAILLGAFVTVSRLEINPVVKTFCPALAAASGMLGSTQIRSLATIGGNLGNASQSADLIPVLAACDAAVILLNSKGNQKACSIDEFITGSGKTSLKQDEVIWSIRIPKNNRLSAFYKIGARKSVTISKLNGCVSAVIENGRVKDPVIYLGAVGSKTLRAPLIEEAINGKLLNAYQDFSLDIETDKFRENEAELLKAAAGAQIETNIPDRPSRHYKKKAVLGLLFNILEDLRIQSEQPLSVPSFNLSGKSPASVGGK